MDEEQAKEVLPFLSTSARIDLKLVALQYFLGLTGTEEGLEFLEAHTDYLSGIVGLTYDEQAVITKDAFLAVLNMARDSKIALKLITLEDHQDFCADLLRYVVTPDFEQADTVCAVLSNLSRSEHCAAIFVDLLSMGKCGVNFDCLIKVFCQNNYNPKAKLHYLGPFLANMTQIQGARKYLLDKERCVIQRLVPFTEYPDSPIRRGGIISTLRNCCFETEFHEWLLSEQVDLLPRLLLPLAGPEEFDDDEMEQLPDDLQYLPPDKERESDPELRKMLVECIYQICSTKPCRQYIKDKRTYVIIRALEMWEKDPAARVAAQKLIQLLISDEPETGMETLHNVKIPAHVEKQLEEARLEQEKEVEEELKTLTKS